MSGIDNNLNVSNVQNLTSTSKNTKQQEVKEVDTKEQNTSSLDKNDNVKFRTYVVKKGDNLWNISGEKLGDSKKWPKIFDLNKDQIKNPNLIYPKQVLRLPIPSNEVQLTEKPKETVKPQEVIVKPTIEMPHHQTAVQDGTYVASVPHKAGLEIKETPKENHADNKTDKTIKISTIAGMTGTVITATALIAVTKSLTYPASNLGGYATAQIVAKAVNSVGFSMPTGASLSKIVSSVGGPKSAGVMTAVGVGVAAAGVAAGGYYLYNKLSK